MFKTNGHKSRNKISQISNWLLFPACLIKSSQQIYSLVQFKTQAINGFVVHIIIGISWLNFVYCMSTLPLGDYVLSIKLPFDDWEDKKFMTLTSQFMIILENFLGLLWKLHMKSLFILGIPCNQSFSFSHPNRTFHVMIQWGWYYSLPCQTPYLSWINV